MRRFITLTLALLLFAPLALPAPAAEGDELPAFDPNEILFPVLGEYRLANNWAAPRSHGPHQGEDIMADKGNEVVAAAAGTVTWTGNQCCGLAIDHGNGWATWYIHLNNDTQNDDGTYSDDGEGWGIADGIEKGTYVEAGQLIGWVGDSGNAEDTDPHLHFEIRKDGVAMDPYPYLLNAEGNWLGQFYDDDDSVHQDNIDKIYAAGITVGCNPPYNNQFCPNQSITRGQMAAFIARALGLTEVSGEAVFDDLDGHQFANAVDKIMTAGIGFGCSDASFCPDRPLERDEMAEMLVRAFDYDNPDGEDFFDDDQGNDFEESINKLAAHGITVGCNPPDYTSYCPDENITRGQMATFFVRVGAA